KPFVSEELRGKLSRALSARRWARDRNLLRGVGETLASSGTTERMLETVVKATLEAMEAERAMVFLREGATLLTAAAAGDGWATDESLVAAARAAVERGRPTAVTGPDGRLVLAAPLLVGGEAAGALVAEGAEGIVSTDEELELLALLSSQAAAALRNA